MAKIRAMRRGLVAQVGGVVAATVAIALVVHPTAAAQGVPDAVEEGAAEQSCKQLTGGTAGLPDEVPAEPSVGIPPHWPEAPAGLLPERVHLRSETETFNRLYEFATRDGAIYGRARDSDHPWRELPLPLCFAGNVASISLDDDEMIVLDTARRIYTMDNALKDGALFNWTSRWGTPVWSGLGYTLPGQVRAWSWSVISPLEDDTSPDPAGNAHPIGGGKISHIWGLRAGGQRLTFWDPWLPPDESYEMCGPHRGRFKATSVSASGSHVFVIGRDGDMFTRLYDFDISGHNRVFYSYSYDDQRGKGDGAPIQLPAEPWAMQPKIPGQITSRISIHKLGTGARHRILRVEGRSGEQTGYWERDIAAPRGEGWRFQPTGLRLQGSPLRNPARDASSRDLGPGEDARYRIRAPGMKAVLTDFNVYCSPARLTVREDGTTQTLALHTVDGLRQGGRARGLDDVPRTQYGAIERPDGTFEEVTIQATRSEILIEEKGWRFERTDAFELGRLTRNRHTGTARLRVWVPASGRITLQRNNRVGRFVRRVGRAGTTTLRVRPRGAALRRLRAARRAGRPARVRVRARVIYAPRGADKRVEARRIALVASRR